MNWEFPGFEDGNVRNITQVGSEEEHERECEIDIERSQGVLNGYSHEWLVDFIESGGRKNVYEDITKVNLFSLLVCDEMV